MARIAFWKDPNKKQRGLLKKLGFEVADDRTPREYLLDGCIKEDKLQRLLQLNLIFVKKVYCRY